MSDMPQTLGAYEELKTDALGERFVEGLPDEVAAPGIEFITQYARATGQIAVREGDAQLVLLGMIDEGVTLDTVVDALVMGGVLEPAGAEELHLTVRNDDTGWEQDADALRVVTTVPTPPPPLPG